MKALLFPRLKWILILLILPVSASPSLDFQGFLPSEKLAPRSAACLPEFDESVVQRIADFLTREISRVRRRKITGFSSKGYLEKKFGVSSRIIAMALNRLKDTDRAFRSDTIKHQTLEPGDLSNSRYRDYLYRGVVYASLSEAALAIMMEKYIPGFKVVKGLNYEVWVGATKMDFLINGFFVEFHPKFYEQNRLRYLEAKKRSGEFFMIGSMNEKIYMDSIPDEELEPFYLEERQAFVDNSPKYRGKKVILVRNERDFYHKVIVPYGEGFPPEDQFVLEFDQARSEVCATDFKIRRANRALKKRDLLRVKRIPRRVVWRIRNSDAFDRSI